MDDFFSLQKTIRIHFKYIQVTITQKSNEKIGLRKIDSWNLLPIDHM